MLYGRAERPAEVVAKKAFPEEQGIILLKA